MKAARRLLIVTVLMIILIVMIFKLPDIFQSFKLQFALAGISLLLVFILTLWQWRRSLEPEDIAEIESVEIKTKAERTGQAQEKIRIPEYDGMDGDETGKDQTTSAGETEKPEN